MKSIGIIGHGDFGRFLETLARRTLPDVEVRVYARKIAPDGARFFSLEEACRCDAVIISVSIRAFEGGREMREGNQKLIRMIFENEGLIFLRDGEMAIGGAGVRLTLSSSANLQADG